MQVVFSDRFHDMLRSIKYQFYEYVYFRGCQWPNIVFCTYGFRSMKTTKVHSCTVCKASLSDIIICNIYTYIYIYI